MKDTVKRIHFLIGAKMLIKVAKNEEIQSCIQLVQFYHLKEYNQIPPNRTIK